MTQHRKHRGYATQRIVADWERHLADLIKAIT